MSITNKTQPNEPIKGPSNIDGGQIHEGDTVENDVSFFESTSNSSGRGWNINESLPPTTMSGNEFDNFQEEKEYGPLDSSDSSKKGKWFALGAAATAVVAAISYSMGSNNDNDSRFTDEYGRKVRVIEVEAPPTTLPPLVAKDQDFRPEAERTFEFTPVYATDGPTKEVLDKLFSNFDKAISQRNPEYLEYYYRDMGSELALEMSSKIEFIDNYYPTKTEYKIIDDHRKGDNMWDIRVEKRIITNALKSETHVRDYVLALKQFSKSGRRDGADKVEAWTVEAEYVVNFDK